MFARGFTLSINSPICKSSKYMADISPDRSRHPFSESSHKDTPISVLVWTLLLGKLINSVDPQGNTSSNQDLRQQQRK